MPNAKREEQLKHFKDFGIDIENLTFNECVDEAIKLLYLYSTAAAFTEQDFLRREIKRALKPNN